jgi:hypothetical protein
MSESTDLERHYVPGLERGRLFDDAGEPRLELVRSLELLERFLPTAPAEILYVGGGPGTYAAYLRGRGYRVRLVDVLPVHVEEARAPVSMPWSATHVTSSMRTTRSTRSC